MNIATPLARAVENVTKASLAVTVAMDSGEEYGQIEQRHADAQVELVRTIMCAGVPEQQAQAMAGAIA